MSEEVSLDDLRLPPKEAQVLRIATTLTYHHPRHDSARKGDLGPITGCGCGRALKLGEWFWRHVAEVLVDADSLDPPEPA